MNVAPAACFATLWTATATELQFLMQSGENLRHQPVRLWCYECLLTWHW